MHIWLIEPFYLEAARVTFAKCCLSHPGYAALAHYWSLSGKKLGEGGGNIMKPEMDVHIKSLTETFSEDAVRAQLDRHSSSAPNSIN